MDHNDIIRLNGILRVLELSTQGDYPELNIFLQDLESSSLENKIEAELERGNFGNIKLIIDNYLFDSSDTQLHGETGRRTTSFIKAAITKLGAFNNDAMIDASEMDPDAYWEKD